MEAEIHNATKIKFGLNEFPEKEDRGYFATLTINTDKDKLTIYMNDAAMAQQARELLHGLVIS